MNTLQRLKNSQQEYIQVRIDSYTKNSVNMILSKLGMTPSQAVKMLFSQIMIKNALPFEVALPENYVEQLSPEESAEVAAAYEDIKQGRYVEVDMADKKQVKKYLGV